MRVKFILAMIALALIVSAGLFVMLWLQASSVAPAPVASPSQAITRLTQNSAMNLRPAFSPDNHLIAFESNRDGDKYHIYLMNRDGNQARALTQGATDDRRPVWTPNGKNILYDSFDGEQEQIWSVNVVDGKAKQLTHVDGLASFASLSPDGKRLAFYVYKDGALNLWTANADGSQAQPLTQSLVDIENEQCTFACHQAAWSPDSQSLVYTGGDGKSIWMMRADGTQPHCLVDDGETNHFPWFLSDGRLAYITEYVPPRYGGAWTNAWAYDLKTGQRSLLEEFMAMQGPMDFSSDGSKVLFHSPRAGNFDTYLIDLNAPGGLSVLQGTPVPPKEPVQ